MQANAGQCRNGDDVHSSKAMVGALKQRKKESKKQTRCKLKGRALHWPNNNRNVENHIGNQMTDTSLKSPL